MYTGRFVFSQIIDYLPRHQFHRCVQRYGGDYKVQKFSCFEQFLCMGFAELTYRESLRDIETCLRAVQPKLYHAGLRSGVSKSTLADANEKRDWRIYADFAQVLIAMARPLYSNEDLGIDLDNTLYALDSTTIDLCLSLFPWARFRKHKGAVKVHTLLDLRGSIPYFIEITDGKVHDVNILDLIIPEAGAYYVMDRAYLHYERLYRIAQCGSFFVTRARRGFPFRRLYSQKVDKSTGLRSDQTVALVSFYPAKAYPERLRRITYLDPDSFRALRVSHQPVCPPSHNHHPDLPFTLADRIVLQMDQTALAHQELVRHLRECCEDSNLDCRQRLCAHRHHPQTPSPGDQFAQNPTDSQLHPI